MGSDFLKKTRAGYRKHIDKGRVTLATPTLLTTTPHERGRSVVGNLEPGASVQGGEKLLVDLRGDRLVASRGNTPVATIASPPSSVLAAIRASRGVASGEVVRVNDLSGTVEVAVQ